MWRFVSSDDSGRHPLLSSLNGFLGRQVWLYDESAGTAEQRQAVEAAREGFQRSRLTQRHSTDELLRLQLVKGHAAALRARKNGTLAGEPTEQNVQNTLHSAISFYQQLQADDGHWPGDYGGPMFLMPGLIIACHVTGCMDKVLSTEHIREMLRYLRNHQNADGGYGLHIEGPSTMFGTALSYVSMRVLGLSPDDPACSAAREWIRARGGATYITSWGKFWLAVLGVYAWEGMNPMPPEMWLLPYSAWTGIGLAHPGRFWCHCRMVYLPMSYVYGRRGTGPASLLVHALREELYPEAYAGIDWNAARNRCAKEDLYYPHPWVQDVLWWTLYQAEPLLLGSWLRRKALTEAIRHIHYEDENTRYVCIGPVNKVLNMLCCWLEQPDSEAFKRHIPRLQDYLWVAEDGMKMQGYNGSQLWDTTFAAQAIAASGLGPQFADCLRRAHRYIDATQVREDCPGPLRGWYRHISRGAWPFSTRDHGWPISDCSSEGLKAVLALGALGQEVVGPPLATERLFDCVNVILSFQNGDGGWATYENTRSYPALELVNPSETFGDIVIDYSYVECSSACMTALAAFRRAHPDHRAPDIEAALRRGRAYVLRGQRADGSWYGSWGVCFTYATWFGCEALAAVGESVADSEAQLRACEFLVLHQRADGAWGESYLSCQDKVYSQSEEGQVVNTAWALLALMSAGYHRRDRRPIEAGVQSLLAAQMPSGDWPQQRIAGVFNRNCMITYANYRNIFPIWALGFYRKHVLHGGEG